MVTHSQQSYYLYCLKRFAVFLVHYNFCHSFQFLLFVALLQWLMFTLVYNVYTCLLWFTLVYICLQCYRRQDCCSGNCFGLSETQNGTCQVGENGCTSGGGLVSNAGGFHGRCNSWLTMKNSCGFILSFHCPQRVNYCCYNRHDVWLKGRNIIEEEWERMSERTNEIETELLTNSPCPFVFAVHSESWLLLL